MCHKCENCGNCKNKEKDVCTIFGIKIGRSFQDYWTGDSGYRYNNKCNLYEHDGSIRPLLCVEAWEKFIKIDWRVEED